MDVEIMIDFTDTPTPCFFALNFSPWKEQALRRINLPGRVDVGG